MVLNATNADGSVDLYFGPEAPKGLENNWVDTRPSKGFFVWFRSYAETYSTVERSLPLALLNAWEKYYGRCGREEWQRRGGRECNAVASQLCALGPRSVSSQTHKFHC